MKIVVSLKVVADYEQVRMAQGATSLDTSSVPRVVYTFDELALEVALRQKDADASNEIVVVCQAAAADKVRDVVKKALAMGADRAVIIEDAKAAEHDSLVQGKILKAALEKLGGVDVLIFGIPGIQGEAFHAGGEVAGLLGWPVVSYASDVKAAGTTLTVERLIERGTQTVEVQTPAVVMVGKFPQDPRLPTFKGIMGAKNKPLETWTLADLGLADVTAGVRTDSVAPPPARGAGRKLEGDAADTAKEAVLALRGKQFI
ncbi:MAG: etfB [Cyanobacteria bacterium RYN_339]|nr:etfB [Cyanobacteria bacterium RYN_339]